jgi:hypothetical protein
LGCDAVQIYAAVLTTTRGNICTKLHGAITLKSVSNLSTHHRPPPREKSKSHKQPYYTPLPYFFKTYINLLKPSGNFTYHQV